MEADGEKADEALGSFTQKGRQSEARTQRTRKIQLRNAGSQRFFATSNVADCETCAETPHAAACSPTATHRTWAKDGLANNASVKNASVPAQAAMGRCFLQEGAMK